jgi:hypothetical protein
MRKIAIAGLILLLCSTITVSIDARMEKSQAPRGPDGFFRPSVDRTPNFENCVHKYNNLTLHISNWGFFGGEEGTYADCEAGEFYRSGEFPAGSNVEYLYQGALWLGAVVGEDTLTSGGADGWMQVNEMWPCADISCAIERRSNRPSDLYYHEDAKSDLEYIAIYTDTLTNQSWVAQDPTDLRVHIPLNVEIRQTSYSWSVDYAQDFILLDYSIRNIGMDEIENLYLGIYSDGDVGHFSIAAERYEDDICGFLESMPSRAGHGFRDTINLTYICDNDGDPNPEGVYDFASCTSILGTGVMRVPGQKKVSFNWWQSNGDPRFDWGPMLDATRRNFDTGGQGTPAGDKNKYYMLSNGEQDYNQIYAAEDFSDEGWLPPAPVAGQIANGGDTRYLLSFGPFDIDRYDSLNLTCAYVAGEALHKYPAANEQYMVQTYNPDAFYSRLDFSDLGDNAVWASWVYDNPGVDTDGDGFFGYFWEIEDTITGIIDTFWYRGDGVPDFRAATAPPPPVLRYTTEVGGVTLRWNGLESETAIDPFTKVADFEGYKVYMGRLRTINAMGLLESRDLKDYKRFYWDTFLNRWITREVPLTLDSLTTIYGAGFYPDDYPCDCDSACDEVDGGWPGEGDDENTYCFEPVDWNQPIEGWRDGAVVSQSTGIHKRFIEEIKRGDVTPDIDIDDTLTSDNWVRGYDPVTGDSVYYHKYYEYEYYIDNILTSVPWHFSVTTFDFGDFTNNLESMESSPLANVQEIWAMNDASVVIGENLEPQVYPNPYVGDGRYWDAGYEDPGRSGFYDHERRIHFINLPYRCTIRIYTLSGDLVRELEHPGPTSDTDSRAQWNLRSRNNELVASGIYLYSVESVWGNYIGKLVIVL